MTSAVGTFPHPWTAEPPAAPQVTPEVPKKDTRTPISCSDCGTRWFRLGWSHCCVSGCHLTFASNRAGDAHTTGPIMDQHHMSVNELIDARWDSGKHKFTYVVEDGVVAWRFR